MDTPSTLQTTPRQRLNSDERQREIVAAVLALARERGPKAITVQAIAGSEAGMPARARQMFPLLIDGYRGRDER
jgi:hypothetical protein